MPPAPRPCTSRPSTNGSIDWAEPAITSPRANSPTPAANGSRGPRRSQIWPATAVENRLVTPKPVNAQA